MKLYFMTIALDAMPFITMHLPIFNQLSLKGIKWEWHIAEGTARNVHCTWRCNEIQPRLSRDGTTEFLHSIRNHPNVHIYQRQSWDGKVEMVNTICGKLESEGILMQVDADELWSARAICEILDAFCDLPALARMDFHAYFYAGWHVRAIIERHQYTYGNTYGTRAWRFTKGDHFKTHAPPVLIQQHDTDVVMMREGTAKAAMFFSHYAYATEEQVRFKDEFYGYTNALVAWKLLQQNKNWPVKLKHYLPWVKDPTLVESF